MAPSPVPAPFLQGGNSPRAKREPSCWVLWAQSSQAKAWNKYRDLHWNPGTLEYTLCELQCFGNYCCLSPSVPFSMQPEEAEQKLHSRAGHCILRCHICFPTAVPCPEPQTHLSSWASLRHSVVCPQTRYPACTQQMVPDRGDRSDGLRERKQQEVGNGSCGREETCEIDRGRKRWVRPES